MKCLATVLFLICVKVATCSNTCVDVALDCPENCPQQLPAPMTTMINILLFPVQPIADLIDGLLTSPLLSPFSLLLSPIERILSLFILPLKILRFLIYAPFYVLTVPLRILKAMLTLVWNVSSMISPVGGFMAFTLPFVGRLGLGELMDGWRVFVQVALNLIQDPIEAIELLHVLLPYFLGAGSEIFAHGFGELMDVLSNYSDCV